MAATLPPFPGDTCISDTATNMTDVPLSTAAEVATRLKDLRGAQVSCASIGVETDMNVV